MDPKAVAALAHVKRLCPKLDAQAKRVKKLEEYFAGEQPLPKDVINNNVTQSYKQLIEMAQSNWPQLIVDSVEERLEVQAFTFKTPETTEKATEIWQRNSLDADAGLVHQAALISGRGYAIVWGEEPQIILDHGTCVYVEYVDGSQREVARALRRWHDGERWNATLYEADAIYKFSTPGDKATTSDAMKWEQRTVEDEEWPLPNDTGRAPVFEIAVNRSLSTDHAKRARGEFEAQITMIDRLNYTMFSMLSAMTWSGFPLRVLTGEPIDWKPKTDKDGEPVVGADGEPVMEAQPPFDVSADRIVQLEDKDAKVHQFDEASLKNYIDTVEMQVKHLAAVTKTPAHYLLGEMVNLSADAIRAAEAGLISKVRRHQRSLGEAWEDVMRYALQLSGVEDADLEAGAEVVWTDPESRSLAERAAAAVQLSSILPWNANAELSLGATRAQVQKWQAERAAEAILSIPAPPDSPKS